MPRIRNFICRHRGHRWTSSPGPNYERCARCEEVRPIYKQMFQMPKITGQRRGDFS